MGRAAKKIGSGAGGPRILSNRHGRLSLVGTFAILALACARPLSAAGDLGGRILLSWRGFDDGTLTTDGLLQQYDLRLERALSGPLQLRLTLRGVDDASGSTLEGATRTRSSHQLQPGVQLFWTLPTVQASLEWNRLETRARDEQEELASSRRLDRLQGSLSFRPEGLPGLALDGRRTTVTDPALGVDLEETFSSLRLDYAWRDLRVGATGFTERTRDRGAGFERDDDNLLATLGWARSFGGDRLSLSTGATAARGSARDRALAGGASVPEAVRFIEAYVSYDETPADGRDHPLEANFLLHDGDLRRAAAVPLGPTAPVNLNLAVDFGRRADVDELRVVARDAAGNPVTSGGAVTWEAWTSLEGTTWTAVAGATTSYDAARGFWSVALPPLGTRWLKIVTFFVNSVPTEVTEVLAFTHGVVAPGREREVDFEQLAANGALAWRVGAGLDLAWTIQYSQYRQRTSGLDTTGRDLGQLLALTWRPRPRSTFELSRQASQATTDGVGFDQSYDAWRGLYRWTANANLQAGAELLRSEEEAGGHRSITQRVSAHAFGRLWRTLDLVLDLGHQRQEFPDEDWATSGPQVTGSARAQLTREVALSAAVSVQRYDVSGTPPAGVVSSPTDERWWLEVSWRPGAQLVAGARFGAASGGGSSTPIQSYRLDWRPFAGGALGLSTLYDENVQPVGNLRSRRFLVSPTWQINPRLNLSLSYTMLSTRSDRLVEDVRYFFVGLSTNL